MANEIQRLYIGSQSSPVPSGNLEAGDYTLTFDGQTTSAIAFDASDATIEAALEALSNVGVGDIDIAATANGYNATFQGALANTNVAQMTAGSITLKQKADTVTISVTQNGIADVNEVQRVDLGGATTGTFDLNGNSTSATVSTLDTAGIQAACDTIWGSGNTAVASLGGDLFSVTFQGAFAGQNIAEMTVTNNTTDGTPVVTTTTQGVTGQSSIVQVWLPDVPTEGEPEFSDDSFVGHAVDWAYDAAAATVQTAINASNLGVATGGVTVTGTGTTADPWIITSVAHSGFFTDWTSRDTTTPLRKACGIEIVTTQEGSAGGGATAHNLLLLGVGA